MTDPTFFNQFLIWPFINALILFYKGFASFSIPFPLGWAIIGLTLTVRTILHPLTKTQMESARRMQELKPELDKLTKKHKGDRKKLQEEQVKLYQKHGINPAAGCLPMLLQFPILIALYQVFFKVLGNGNIEETVGAINTIAYHPALRIESLDLSFFGLQLGYTPSQWQTAGWWLLAIPVVTAGLQWYQTKKLMPPVPVADKPDKDKGKKDESFAVEMQKQMALIMPVMIGVFSYSLPIGLSLYWNTYTVLALVNGKKKKDYDTNSKEQKSNEQ
ncbi:MAG TPA: YidC/Oxa1 family membrane protein insertase [Patescibacteria group bacterium]|nr:YidC/Oxa1 family membrane protein insertase [Patescibacteria group bacterium]